MVYRFSVVNLLVTDLACGGSQINVLRYEGSNTGDCLWETIPDKGCYHSPSADSRLSFLIYAQTFGRDLGKKICLRNTHNTLYSVYTHHIPSLTLFVPASQSPLDLFSYRTLFLAFDGI